MVGIIVRYIHQDPVIFLLHSHQGVPGHRINPHGSRGVLQDRKHRLDCLPQ